MSGPSNETQLPKAYDPSMTEEAVTARWREAGISAAAASGTPEVPSYSVLIPPPNVTAALHLGHALNNTLQDVMVRYHRMRGDRTLWMPGTDHAGIATQTVVEKRLLAQGIKRLDLGREAFVAKTQEWKDEYEQIIVDQLLAMGASCDWDRLRFTMDEMCSVAVRHAFYEMFADGLIYRGKRLVNWDPATQTALADDEVEMENVDGHMWYLTYPLTDGTGSVTVATTRPETMLGDTAVAVNPDDPRAGALRGKTVSLPIVGREIPIVEDDYVVMPDPESSDTKAQIATGFLKVTPAHDPNDWDIGLRHDLPVINVMGPDGAISDAYGWDDVSDEARAFIGMDRYEARSAIVDWFEANGLLAEVRAYSHSVGHSYRSHVPIEPWLSDQWFVAVTDDRLAGEALRAQNPNQAPPLPEGTKARSGRSGDGELTFYPDRYARTYHAWHDNIRDWCISRQLWWGHQIPVWLRTMSLASADEEIAATVEGAAVDQPHKVDSRWSAAGAAHVVRKVTDAGGASLIEEAVCLPPQSTLSRLERADTSLDVEKLAAALEAEGFERDPDVLDTWFSSGLWPLSTMGWPYPEDYPDTVGLLASFNPTSVLMTAREIITLWVSRMTMFNRYFRDGDLPFTDVFIHAMIQDGHGQKMSKSLGNGVDPRDIIYSHGADAMRYTLVQMTTDTQDVRMPVDMVCPYTGETFTPETTTTSAGHVVAAPVQTSPSDPSKTMVSAYGVAAGEVEPSEDRPLARNTSPKFDAGRNFANKVWNATRFALGRIPTAGDGLMSDEINLEQANFVDQWIVARLAQTLETIEAALDRYHFNVYADALYDFIWRDVCDRYLEAVKPTIDDDPRQQAILAAVLDAALRLLHPVSPFVTEALFPHVQAVRSADIAGVPLGRAELAAIATWPRVAPGTVSEEVVGTFERADKLVAEIRTLRAARQVKPKQQITLHGPGPILELIEQAQGAVETLAGIGDVIELTDANRPALASPLAFEGSEVLLSGLVDELNLDAERTRLVKLIDAKSRQVEGFEKRLANPNYVSKAKPELVAETRNLLNVARDDLAAAQTALASLTG